MSWLTTTSAVANTASAAAWSPADQSKIRLLSPALEVVADQLGARVEGAVRVHDRWQRFVLDVDQLERVAGRVPVPRDDERDLLALESDLVGREHGLHIGGQGRHPGKVARGKRLPGNHGLDAGVRLRGSDVDRPDLGVRERAAQYRPVEHAGQGDIVDKDALAAQETCVLLARHWSVRLVKNVLGIRCHATSPSSRSSSAPDSYRAAHRTDRTMFS